MLLGAKSQKLRRPVNLAPKSKSHIYRTNTISCCFTLLFFNVNDFLHNNHGLYTDSLYILRETNLSRLIARGLFYYFFIMYEYTLTKAFWKLIKSVFDKSSNSQNFERKKIIKKFINFIFSSNSHIWPVVRNGNFERFFFYKILNPEIIRSFLADIFF